MHLHNLIGAFWMHSVYLSPPHRWHNDGQGHLWSSVDDVVTYLANINKPPTYHVSYQFN